MYDGHWSFASDLSDQWKQYGMPELIGDQVKDAAQLKATSPLVQAARIKAPLLLAYGGIDQRVPMYHGRKLLDAIKPHNSRWNGSNIRKRPMAGACRKTASTSGARSKSSSIEISAAGRRRSWNKKRRPRAPFS